MTASEFSNQFDLLWNNIASNQSAGLNEYEKSVFLTKAQNEIVKNYFNPKSNAKQEGFDSTAKRQADFSMLLKTYSQRIGAYTADSPFDPRAFVVTFPKDLFIVINEQVRDETATKLRQVIALQYPEYTKLMSKPYKEPLKFQAWRLITNTQEVTETETGAASDTATSTVSTSPWVEIVLNHIDRKKAEEAYETYEEDKDNSSWEYVVRYIKKPLPIILENFTDAFGEDISIDGYNGSETFYNTKCCELDPYIHEEILQRAVELAKVAWGGDANQINAVLQAGQRSE